MIKNSRILVPTDFSEVGASALEHAEEWAKLWSATLTLFHAYEEPYDLVTDATVTIPGEPPQPLRKLVRHITEKKLNDLVQSVRKRDVRAEGKLEEGEPSTEIIREVKAGNYDLIIIGTHGRRGLKRALLGSVAERVVRLAPCPVLTVRGQTFEALQAEAEQARTS